MKLEALQEALNEPVDGLSKVQEALEDVAAQIAKNSPGGGWRGEKADGHGRRHEGRQSVVADSGAHVCSPFPSVASPAIAVCTC